MPIVGLGNPRWHLGAINCTVERVLDGKGRVGVEQGQIETERLVGGQAAQLFDGTQDTGPVVVVEYLCVRRQFEAAVVEGKELVPRRVAAPVGGQLLQGPRWLELDVAVALEALLGRH